MHKGRLEAFSDGVFAILITIMVLELKTPNGDTPAALRPMVPTLLTYVLSFVFLGIYWNNHHHMLQAARQISGRVLWPNLHLLFWLSLVPFVTAWMGESHFASWPVAAYGIVLLCAAVAYTILQTVLIRAQGAGSTLALATGRDAKGLASMALYVVALPLAFVRSWAACAIYAVVALIWLVPDRRIERRVAHEAQGR